VGLRWPRARQRLARGGVRPSSEAETCPRGRQALERGRDSPEGRIRPSSEAETRPRGRWPLERGRDSAVRRPVLERDADSPEGYNGQPLGGPLRIFGSWALLLWVATTRSVFCD
jgi:hypothetical protein